jgi:hypothetical protein
MPILMALGGAAAKTGPEVKRARITKSNKNRTNLHLLRMANPPFFFLPTRFI